MKGIKSYDHLVDVPERMYQGYIWYSNQAEPTVYKDFTKFSFKVRNINPFVVEALLFSKRDDNDKGVSVMIRHTGNYQIREYDLNNIPEGAKLSEEKKYFPHRLHLSGDKICFRRLWLPEPDKNCEDMEVLTLITNVFTGFKNNKM